MRRLLIWGQGELAPAETGHNVVDLDDLRDLLTSKIRSGIFYIEARPPKGREALESRLRFSPDDLTDEDFQWLTAPVTEEVRGVRL